MTATDISSSGALPATLQPIGRLIDRPSILLYAGITDDFNPIHVDDEFAARTPMGGIIAHGMLSLNLIWQSLRASLGPVAGEDVELSVRFTRPVRIDDVVTVGGRLTDERQGLYEVWVRNQNDEAVIAGTVRLRGGRAS